MGFFIAELKIEKLSKENRPPAQNFSMNPAAILSLFRFLNT